MFWILNALHVLSFWVVGLSLCILFGPFLERYPGLSLAHDLLFIVTQSIWDNQLIKSLISYSFGHSSVCNFITVSMLSLSLSTTMWNLIAFIWYFRLVKNWRKILDWRFSRRNGSKARIVSTLAAILELWPFKLVLTFQLKSYLKIYFTSFLIMLYCLFFFS